MCPQPEPAVGAPCLQPPHQGTRDASTAVLGVHRQFGRATTHKVCAVEVRVPSEPPVDGVHEQVVGLAVAPVPQVQQDVLADRADAVGLGGRVDEGQNLSQLPQVELVLVTQLLARLGHWSTGTVVAACWSSL